MFEKIIEKSLLIINFFPKAKNGQPFLSLKNERKLFFNRFIKKYGLDGRTIVYNKKDIIRRLRLIEFFDYFTKEFLFKEIQTMNKQKRYIIESNFHRMIIIEVKIGIANKLELLSFYPL